MEFEVVLEVGVAEVALRGGSVRRGLCARAMRSSLVGLALPRRPRLPPHRNLLLLTSCAITAGCSNDIGVYVFFG